MFTRFGPRKDHRGVDLISDALPFCLSPLIVSVVAGREEAKNLAGTGYRKALDPHRLAVKAQSLGGTLYLTRSRRLFRDA
jgi:hypothetical protein